MKPALRYHGAKFRLAPWVMSFFPAHACYVEPYGGAAGVLLQKQPSYSEVYNDLDGDVVNFFRVLQCPEQRAKLIERVILTPYSRAEFEKAWEPCSTPIERARRLAIRSMMGFGSAGATRGVTGFRIDSKREYGTNPSLWQRYPLAIAEAGQRLLGVLIENRTALRVMADHDAPSTLHFVDPPYLHATRDAQSGGLSKAYRHEMSDLQHAELLEAVCALTGMVVLCGYESELYDKHLSGWTRHTTSARIAGARGTSIRTEVVWLNPACAARLEPKPQRDFIFAEYPAVADVLEAEIHGY